MEIINGEARDLLIELIHNKESDIAEFLAGKFEGLNFLQDSHLRLIIDYLIRKGYLDIPEGGWADNVPCFASLTYEGETYLDFEERMRQQELKNLTQTESAPQSMPLRPIIDAIEKVKRCFHNIGGDGMPQVNVIVGEEFEEWRSKIQYAVQGIRQDEFTIRILELTNSFNGWNDEKVFTELCSKLRIVSENYDKFYSLAKRSEESKMDRKKVFVVHGRNENIRRSMFDFLRSIGLNPIEWDEAKQMTGKPTPYVGEVLDVVFASAQTVIVLMTPEDEAKLMNEFIQLDDKEYERNITPQARLNVIYEAGMAMGRCPDRTVLVEFGRNLRPYSDIGGLNVIRIVNDSPQKRSSLIAAIRTAGAEVDDLTIKSDWITTGNFNIS